jgi:membrane protease YdiL (CAAX protease family)
MIGFLSSDPPRTSGEYVEMIVNNKQKIAIIAPLVLIGMMYPIFQFMSRVFGDRMGWYIGLVMYWIIWGGAFSWLMIGRQSIGKIIRPKKLTLRILLLILFPLLMATLYKFIPGMEYDKPSVWIFLLLVSTNFGNGFFEELLWRGVYMSLFPGSLMFRIIWPSIWFALWHYVPGSVIANGNVIGLIIGSGLMGFYLSFLARKTDTIWWTIVTHTIGGFIMIL